MKRIISLILALCMLVTVLTAFPVVTYAATSGTCGDNLTWTLDDNGTLTISGTGEMTNYSYSINVPWYSLRSSIKNVIIENGVTTIGEHAFNSCRIKSIIIPNSVTSIGVGAFGFCYSLTSITIPESVVSIGDQAFVGCNSLTSITVDENNIYFVNDEFGVLFDKDKTKLLQYPDGNSRKSYDIPVTHILCADRCINRRYQLTGMGF